MNWSANVVTRLEPFSSKVLRNRADLSFASFDAEAEIEAYDVEASVEDCDVEADIEGLNAEDVGGLDAEADIARLDFVDFGSDNRYCLVVDGFWKAADGFCDERAASVSSVKSTTG